MYTLFLQLFDNVHRKLVMHALQHASIVHCNQLARPRSLLAMFQILSPQQTLVTNVLPKWRATDEQYERNVRFWREALSPLNILHGIVIKLGNLAELSRAVTIQNYAKNGEAIMRV